MKRKLVIYGAGELAELAHFYFTHDSDYTPVAFCVDAEYKKGESFLNLPLVSFDEVEKRYPPGDYTFFCAVGYRRMRLRSEPYGKVKAKGYRCANYVSSRAVLQPDTIMGENNFIMQGVVVEPFVTMGHNNVIWSSSLIASSTVLGDHVYISGMVVLSSSVKVLNKVFVGVHATVLDCLTINEEAFISAGSLVTKDAKPYTLYAGSPARGIRSYEAEGYQVPAVS